MVKNTTEYFLGIFFTVSLIYFSFMFYALKDRKADLTEIIISRNKLGEEETIQNPQKDLLEI